jgi:hypothetical protein
MPDRHADGTAAEEKSDAGCAQAGLSPTDAAEVVLVHCSSFGGDGGVGRDLDW